MEREAIDEAEVVIKDWVDGAREGATGVMEEDGEEESDGGVVREAVREAAGVRGRAVTAWESVKGAGAVPQLGMRVEAEGLSGIPAGVACWELLGVRHRLD